MSFKALLSLPFFVLFACSPELETAPDLSSGLWIDVRNETEYEEGHLPRARNIPHTEIGKRIGEVTLDTDAEIHVYCRSGRRSGMAKQELEKLGYRRVSNAGGYEDLLEQLQAIEEP